LLEFFFASHITPSFELFRGEPMYSNSRITSSPNTTLPT
jgi:hypothetical protein